MQVPLVIANHPDLEPCCADFGVPFVCVPVTKESKADAEATILQLLEDHQIDLAVLAKYMQVLSGDFLARFPEVINIHHSFLPAFKGAQPYHRAWERGVKLIGATAHYVTDRLKACDVEVSRLAHGVPVGGELDYLDDGTLATALKARRPF